MRYWISALAIFVWSHLALADPPPGYPFLSFDQGMKQAQQEKRPVFLYFGRFGCGWCDKTNKEAFSDAGLRKLYTEHYVLVYVDAESGKRLRLPSGERITEADLGSRYRAFATPLFVFLLPDGSEIARVPGVQSTQDFINYDRYVTQGFYKTQTLVQFLNSKS